MRGRVIGRGRPFLGLFALLAVITIACGGGDTDPPPPPPIAGAQNPAAAVVRVELLITGGSKATVRYWGTGAFVAPGIVLTSARLLDSAGGWDTIGIATGGPNGAVSLAYQADLVAIDPSLDVALLRVAADRKGSEIDPATLRVASLAVAGPGPSPAMPPSATVVGFTALSSEQPAATRIEFSRRPGGELQWAESDTLLSAGFGGAPVLDDEAKIIGLVALPEPADDRLFVRPIGDALALIEAAVKGDTLLRSGRERLPPPDRRAVDRPIDLDITGITFYADVSASGQPLDPAASFPSGTKRIIYTFEYRGMRPGVKWLDQWVVDGRPDPQLSPPRPPWDRSPNGRFVASINDPQGLDDGVYSLRIIVDGIEIGSAATRVGPGASEPRLERLVIAPAKGDNNEPLGQARRLNAADTLYGFFDFAGLDRTATWGYVWYHDGEKLVERDGLRWRGGSAGGGWWVALYRPDGSALKAGHYTLTLLLDHQPAATASIQVDRGA